MINAKMVTLFLAVCIAYAVYNYDCNNNYLPLSSDRQNLSYGNCLEVRGEIIRTVLCCVVY